MKQAFFLYGNEDYFYTKILKRSIVWPGFKVKIIIKNIFRNKASILPDYFWLTTYN